MDKDNRIKELEERNAQLESELQATKEHLKKYTAPASSKVYYEKNKELVKERVKKCREKNKNINKKTTDEKREEALIRKQQRREILKERYGDEEYKQKRAKELADYRKSKNETYI
jgi:hypothetical protein